MVDVVIKGPFGGFKTELGGLLPGPKELLAATNVFLENDIIRSRNGFAGNEPGGNALAANPGRFIDDFNVQGSIDPASWTEDAVNADGTVNANGQLEVTATANVQGTYFVVNDQTGVQYHDSDTSVLVSVEGPLDPNDNDSVKIFAKLPAGSTFNPTSGYSLTYGFFTGLPFMRISEYSTGAENSLLTAFNLPMSLGGVARRIRLIVRRSAPGTYLIIGYVDDNRLAFLSFADNASLEAGRDFPRFNGFSCSPRPNGQVWKFDSFRTTGSDGEAFNSAVVGIYDFASTIGTTHIALKRAGRLLVGQFGNTQYNFNSDAASALDSGPEFSATAFGSRLIVCDNPNTPKIFDSSGNGHDLAISAGDLGTAPTVGYISGPLSGTYDYVYTDFATDWGESFATPISAEISPGSATEEYTLVESSWADSTFNLPSGLVASQIAVIGSNVYLFGGNDGAPSNKIYRAPISDPETWIDTGNTLPSNLFDSQVAVIGNFIYLFGGFIGSATDKIYRAPISDPETWIDTNKTLPGVLFGSQIAVIGSNVYLFGGNDGAPSNKIYRAPISDPETWIDTGDTLPSTLYRSQLLVIDDTVYLFGGNTGVSVNVIYSADVASPTIWTNTGDTLPSILSFSHVAVIGDFIYLFGGFVAAFTDIIYRAALTDPTTWINTANSLPTVLSRSQVLALPNYVYLLGGEAPGIIDTIFKATIDRELTSNDPGPDVSANKSWKALGDSIQLGSAGIRLSVFGPLNDSRVDFRKIYRRKTSIGETSHFFVAKIPIADASFDDTTLDANVTRTEIAPPSSNLDFPASRYVRSTGGNVFFALSDGVTLAFTQVDRPNTVEDTVKIGFDLSDEIVGIGLIGQAFIILKKRSIWKLRDVSNPELGGIEISPIGCIGPKAFTETPDGIYFMSNSAIWKVSENGQTDAISMAGTDELSVDINGVLQLVDGSRLNTISCAYDAPTGIIAWSFPLPSDQGQPELLGIYSIRHSKLIGRPVWLSWNFNGRQISALGSVRDSKSRIRILIGFGDGIIGMLDDNIFGSDDGTAFSDEAQFGYVMAEGQGKLLRCVIANADFQKPIGPVTVNLSVSDGETITQIFTNGGTRDLGTNHLVRSRISRVSRRWAFRVAKNDSTTGWTLQDYGFNIRPISAPSAR